MSCDAGWWRSKAARLSETRMQEGTMHRLWNRIDFAFSSAWQNFWRNVAVKDIRDLWAIDQEVRTSPQVDKSPATNFEPNVIDKIILLARVAGIAGLVLIIGLTGLSVFIIMLTIRTAIYLRRKEIEVMKLVGATDWFVRWPFIVEGLIVGVVGAVVAVLIVGFGYRPAVVNLQSVLIFVPLAFDPYYLRVVLAAMLGFGLLLGSVGSYLGVRRFLKQ